MKVHAITTGTVRITLSWQHGHGAYLPRLVRSLTDPRLTDPLPIWCYLIEHPEGLILIDTGIPANANDPVWFPPFMLLVQRAATFQIEGAEQEIAPQMRALGFSPGDVRWVILTHLHQDHDGGLHHFPNAEFLVACAEWDVAQGISGRMAGYLNQRWSPDFAPTPISYEASDATFGGRHLVTQAGDVSLVPTPGHSAGHQCVIVEEGDHVLMFGGDSAYSQALLQADALDGVGQSAAAAHETHRCILTFARETPTVFLPSHEWDAARRLETRILLWDNA